MLLNDDFPEMSGGKSIDAEGIGRNAGHHPPHGYRRGHQVPEGARRRRDGRGSARGPVLGDRYGVVQDPFGHHWSFGTAGARGQLEEIQEAMKQHQ